MVINENSVSVNVPLQIIMRIDLTQFHSLWWACHVVVKCVKDYQLIDATTIMEELLLILMDTICTVWIHIRVLFHRFQWKLPLKMVLNTVCLRIV